MNKTENEDFIPRRSKEEDPQFYSKLEGRLEQCNSFFAQEICLGRNRAPAGASAYVPGITWQGRNLTHQGTTFVFSFVSAWFSFHQLEGVNIVESQRGVRNRLSSHGEPCLDYASVGDCLPPLSLPSSLIDRIWPQVWPEFVWKEVKSYLKG